MTCRECCEAMESSTSFSAASSDRSCEVAFRSAVRFASSALCRQAERERTHVCRLSSSCLAKKPRINVLRGADRKYRCRMAWRRAQSLSFGLDPLELLYLSHEVGLRMDGCLLVDPELLITRRQRGQAGLQSSHLRHRQKSTDNTYSLSLGAHTRVTIMWWRSG